MLRYITLLWQLFAHMMSWVYTEKHLIKIISGTMSKILTFSKSLFKLLSPTQNKNNRETKNFFQHFFQLHCCYFTLTAKNLSQFWSIEQRYTYRVLQKLQMKLMFLNVWAEPAVFGSTKIALKFKYIFK